MAARTELCLRLANSPGALQRACRVLADARVNIVALTVEAAGTLRMVVDNPLRAAGALEEADYRPEQRDVLVVELPNGPGALADLTQLLAGTGVNVEYAYATAVEGQPTAQVVVGVEDARRAATATGI